MQVHFRELFTEESGYSVPILIQLGKPVLQVQCCSVAIPAPQAICTRQRCGTGSERGPIMTSKPHPKMVTRIYKE